MRGLGRAGALALALSSLAAAAAQCKPLCEEYYERCRKSCASGDLCATECEDDQQVCIGSCMRNHASRGAIDSDLAARRRQREHARAKQAK
jgi:hypothetical protein